MNAKKAKLARKMTAAAAGPQESRLYFYAKGRTIVADKHRSLYQELKQIIRSNPECSSKLFTNS